MIGPLTLGVLVLAVVVGMLLLYDFFLRPW